jgi:hypothetical protein
MKSGVASVAQQPDREPRQEHEPACDENQVPPRHQDEAARASLLGAEQQDRNRQAEHHQRGKERALDRFGEIERPAVGGRDVSARQRRVGGRRDGGRVDGRHQTFSTSGRPRIPEGMKVSTMARIEKAATSLYSIEK